MKTLGSSCPYCLGSGTYGAAMPQVDGEAISDAAVEAACVVAYGEVWISKDTREYMRRALAAALPHLSPLPQQGTAVDELLQLAANWATASRRAAKGEDHWGQRQFDQAEQECAEAERKFELALYAAPQPAAPAFDALLSCDGFDIALRLADDGKYRMPDTHKVAAQAQVAGSEGWLAEVQAVAQIADAAINGTAADMRDIMEDVAERLTKLTDAPASQSAALNEPSGNSERLAGVADGWQTIDSAPRDGTVILTTHVRYNRYANGTEEWSASSILPTKWDVARGKFETGCMVQPTHWHPAPSMAQFAAQPAPSAGEQA